MFRKNILPDRFDLIDHLEETTETIVLKEKDPVKDFVGSRLKESFVLRLGNRSPIGESSSPTGADMKWIGKMAPLRPLMEKALVSRGITPPFSLPVLVQEFYNEVVRKSKVDEFHDFRNLPELYLADRTKDHADENTEGDQDQKVSPIVSALITGVFDYITAVQEKKNAGETLNKTEQVVTKASDLVNKQIATRTRSDIEQGIGGSVIGGIESLYKNRSVIIVVVLFVVGILLFRNVKLK